MYWFEFNIASYTWGQRKCVLSCTPVLLVSWQYKTCLFKVHPMLHYQQPLTAVACQVQGNLIKFTSFSVLFNFLFLTRVSIELSDRFKLSDAILFYIKKWSIRRFHFQCQNKKAVGNAAFVWIPCNSNLSDNLILKALLFGSINCSCNCN